MKKSLIDQLNDKLKAAIAAIAMPRTTAEKADLRYNIKEQRLALQKRVDELQKMETDLNEWFIANLPKSEASGIAGKLARIQLGAKHIPRVVDWDKFYAHVKKTGNFDLMQRRLSEGAVQERWENKKDVPGVESFTVVTVSCTKL